MTDPRRQRFAPYLRQLADTLALRDWKIRLVDDGPAAPDSYACINLTYARRLATIRISDALLDETPEEIRYCLVHELIHCHLEAAGQIAIDAMPDVAKPAFRRMAEHAVDGLAAGISPLLPLPGETEVETERIKANTATTVELTEKLERLPKVEFVGPDRSPGMWPRPGEKAVPYAASVAPSLSPCACVNYCNYAGRDRPFDIKCSGFPVAPEVLERWRSDGLCSAPTNGATA